METQALYVDVPTRQRRAADELLEQHRAQRKEPRTLAGLVVQSLDELLLRELPGYESVLAASQGASVPTGREGTVADIIMHAVAARLRAGAKRFTRAELRDEAGIDKERWTASFNPILQGMRADQPGGAPSSGARYKDVFRRVARGEYELTAYGQTLVSEYL